MKTTRNTTTQITRRSFLREVGVVGGTVLLGGGVSAAERSRTTPSGALPQRILGRTGEKVTALAFGTWPCGKCKELGVDGVARLTEEALDLGINYLDTARAYDSSEAGIAKALGGKRDQVFLATKVWADTADEARASLEESLRVMRTDYFDVVYIHSMGNRDLERVLGKNGALEYLVKQKEAGAARFLGISGHNLVPNFPPMIETGQIDVVIMAMNFVDRHTYGFEEKVLPVARKHNVGVACMKVYGGMKGGFGVAEGPNTGPEMPADRKELAVRYALGLPGVATLVIGPHTVQHLRQNAEFVRNYKPLTETELAEVDKLGQRLAKGWGPHFGPVA
jgi:predicted aldo/keto reductase-like oxidoreductase